MNKYPQKTKNVRTVRRGNTPPLPPIISPYEDVTGKLNSLKNGLYFLPLGGSGEIGMNANFYYCDGQWLMVDNGITFSRSGGLQNTVLMTNIRHFLAAITPGSLVGLVITHAHEDHVGAAGYLYHDYGCPIYATPFTAKILRNKLDDCGHRNVAVQQVMLNGMFSCGVFDMEFVSLTHSIPEPSAVLIKTPHGNIFHTGDWKIDPEPLIGEPIDKDRLKDIGDKGVLAMVCDSTNVFEEGESGSEKKVQDKLIKRISQCKGGRVVFSCFSSNQARLLSGYKAAKASGRDVVIMGRSMEKMEDAARECAYLGDEVKFLSLKDAQQTEREKILVITTGSQAEPGAALTRMAYQTHPWLHLTAGDYVIFSSRVIPGNQEGLRDLCNRFIERDIHVIMDPENHVSGHPCRDELRELYSLIRPQIAIPVHGEGRHLLEHQEFAKKELQIPFSIRPFNGSLWQLQKDTEPHLLGTVKTGRLALDGTRLVEDQGVVRSQRAALSEAGMMMINVIVHGQQNKIISIKPYAMGVFEYDMHTSFINNVIKHDRHKEQRLRKRIMQIVQYMLMPQHTAENKNTENSTLLLTKENIDKIGPQITRLITQELGITPVVILSVTDMAKASVMV